MNLKYLVQTAVIGTALLATSSCSLYNKIERLEEQNKIRGQVMMLQRKEIEGLRKRTSTYAERLGIQRRKIKQNEEYVKRLEEENKRLRNPTPAQQMNEEIKIES